MAKRMPVGGGQELHDVQIKMPAELASLLNLAARRRAYWEGGSPSVSRYVLEILEKHRDEIEREAQSEMRL
jgi:hypothetical protein